VVAARSRQRERFGDGSAVRSNAQMPAAQTQRVCRLGAAEHRLLEAAMHRLGLSARAYVRVLRVARTIADLDASERIEAAHLAEAIQYRSLDRPLAA
jgi:magnesium chelatase family protein